MYSRGPTLAKYLIDIVSFVSVCQNQRLNCNVLITHSFNVYVYRAIRYTPLV